jgi:phosphatidate cytidylyltransferase
MLQRILTGLLLIPPVIYLIGWAPKWLFLLALLITVEISLHEFFTLSRYTGFKAFSVIGYVAGALVCLIESANYSKAEVGVLLLLVFLVLATLSLALRRGVDVKDYLGSSATTIFGILYVGFLLSCLVPLRFSNPAMGLGWLIRPGISDDATGRKTILLLFLVIWAGDIFAFLGGRTLGRRPLMPRVSPKKTLEGAIAGFGGSMIVAWALAHWFWQAASLKTVMLLAAIIALAGQVGDLVESALKRGANQKDSGTLLPGHGGLLDRIDSLIFGAPALWLVLALKDLWP